MNSKEREYLKVRAEQYNRDLREFHFSVESDLDENSHIIIGPNGVPCFRTRGTHALTCAVAVLRAQAKGVRR